MMKFNREEGLTLIELLITIAVIAIVAAISIPVITNVISSSETNAAASMDAQVDAFAQKYDTAGTLSYNSATQTFTGSVDLNGDGDVDDNGETIETFTVDATQFTVTEDLTAGLISDGTRYTVAAAQPENF